MHLRGIIQTAVLEECTTGNQAIEMVLRIQGVGPTQPRKLVVPYALLLEDESLDPEGIVGRGFEAEVEQDPAKRWVISQITFASKVLRPAD